MDQKRVLVTDFDGTMTEHDFYTLVVQRLLPVGIPDYWVDYRAGRITHFEALQSYFGSIQGDESSVNSLLAEMNLDRNLKPSVEALEARGWQVIVASAGCRWYIDKLLQQAAVNLEIHANPGRFEIGKGLLMERPVDSPYRSEDLGVDKAAVVRRFRDAGAVVAFAGDGFPDVDAARLVAPEMRFARRDLASVLQKHGEGFHSFQVWSDIANYLAARS